LAAHQPAGRSLFLKSFKEVLMAAPFKVYKKEIEPLGPKRTTSQVQGEKFKNWMERLVKLIPAEVLSLYLAGKGIAESWLGYWAAVCLVIVFVFRAWGTKEEGKKVQWAAVIIATVSFVIWIYAIGDYFISFTLPDARIPSLIVLVWTFMVSAFYKGD
jgi:hypothetical protein